MNPDLRALLARHDCLWSVGTPAAVIGFRPSGVVVGNMAESGPARLWLLDDSRLLAFETLSADPFGWNHGLALCVAARRRGPPCGIDDGIVRVLFRPDAGDAPEPPGKWPDTWPGTWIVETEAARVEHWQAAGPPPFHVLGRAAHSAATPLPEGWLPAAHVFPPREGFEALLARYGRPDLQALKQDIRARLAAGIAPETPADRHSRATLRIALRQWLAETGGPLPDAWLRHDPALRRRLSQIDSPRPGG